MTTAHIDVPLVRRLVAAQFPEWADLPVVPVEPGGWDNRTFRLGAELLVRLPSAAAYAVQVAKEQEWLPRLAPQLPLPVPVPRGQGSPGAGFPWPWSVYRWLDGTDASGTPVGDLSTFATDLAGFLTALQLVDTAGGPPAGPHSWFRGAPLTHYAGETHAAIEALGGSIDGAAATAVWAAAASTSWDRPPRWFHGDVAAGNLVVRDGRLAAVLDFGTCGVGDPACDLVIAWTFFTDRSRAAFRAGLDLDDGTWLRARGWALWKALVVRAGLAGTNAAEQHRADAVLAAVLADD
ncbi:aminoglycoside phosphotransferase family protein [Modestobacter sp. VKM Ac-2977]|uniref:aminoglycoside phosphotransferase family protein n=1 Tax=Modestobacter sp. VKM Ac-2977 TaxID=3004131 RepID=UPI0022AA7D53|nr:aminoglycoside phosphotransferase family protein [Modestobacter sp. VKM Ac-2977]MCZ2821967.1 aminoglycoside phosphotransferase family protein [Modestobacter sp. VKM Ac-2977]